MIRTIAIALGLLMGASLLSNIHFGHSRAGKAYINKQRKKRRSIRPGVGYYGVYGYSRRGYRGGK